jgi:hypothetical protein
MTQQEAEGWLERVGARVLHHPTKEGSERAWATLVSTPGAAGRRGRIIISFGRSLADAANAAERRWDEIWDDISAIH